MRSQFICRECEAYGGQYGDKRKLCSTHGNPNAQCEYNPQEKRPKCYGEACFNAAAVVLGHDGKWHVCDSCARLPEFNRFRVKQRLDRCK